MKSFSNLSDSEKVIVQGRFNFALKMILSAGIDELENILESIYFVSLTEIIDFDNFKAEFLAFFNMYNENHGNC